MKGDPAGHMKAAHRALRSCRMLLNEDDRTGACNRAYYAMFHAAHAALRTAGIIEPGVIYKSHSGLVSAFGKELVVTGKLPSTLGSAVSRVPRVRLLADHDSDAVDEADAEWVISEAERFVASVAEALPKLAA